MLIKPTKFVKNTEKYSQTMKLSKPLVNYCQFLKNK